MCGVTGALAGAFSCASAILRRNLFRAVQTAGRPAEAPPADQRSAA